MTGRMRLYIGLLVLGLVLVGGGSWGLLNSPPRIDIPEGTPVIAMELDFVMRGEFDKLYLYDDGTVLYVEEKNLRMPTPEYPPTRVWYNGQVQTEELNRLIRLFQTDEFTGMNDYYQFSGKPMQPIEGAPSGGFTVGDGSFKFSINYGGLQKAVTAFGYLTPDKGLTYPDMPYPLNDIYQELKQVIDNTEEVYSEPIQSSTDKENDNEPEASSNAQEITANRVHIEKGEYILFSGYSQLPEGTYLQTQLYANEKPLEWWPEEEMVAVINGNWQITASLENDDDSIYVFNADDSYLFEIWQIDDTSVRGGLRFDLRGPPPAVDN